MIEEKQKMSNRVNNQNQQSNQPTQPTAPQEPTTPQEPTAPQQPQPQPKPKLPNWASILIIVIAAVIVVGLVSWGGYELFKPAPPEETGGEGTEQEEELPEDEFADLPSEDLSKEGWKTYRNEEYGFEVKYPENFAVYEDLCDPCNAVNFLDKEFSDTHDISVNKMVDFEIFIDGIIKGEDLISGHYSSPAGPGAITYEFLNSETVVINGKEFIKKNYKDIPPIEEYQAFKFSSWHIENKGKKYTLVYNNGVTINPEPYEDLFDQILSTFKFIETDETANWKSYTNGRVGYKFSYPSTNLTFRGLYETIKYPSTREGDSKTQDFVQFAVGKTLFGIRTYVGEGKSTIESWIQEPNTERAYYDLGKYEKVTIGGKTAYRIKGDAFVYVLANGNIYEISAYQDIGPAPIKVSDEPLFDKWANTIQFTK